MTKDLVRHNINLLEYPLWFQDDRMAETQADGMTWKDLDGFIYRSGYKIPVKTDAIFLLYLLLQCQKAGYAEEIRLTRYQVLRDCDLDFDSKWYDRLEDSLERWKMVGIKFEGSFYDGHNYQAINFGIIDSWSIHEETKELKVVFSPSFIKMMLGKGFFKYINFTEFKKLRSSLATRLYEILTKSYQGREEWSIESGLLAQKIPMAERYPAHIVPKIRAAVNRINRSTGMCFNFSTRRSAKDPKKIILVFQKVPEAAPASQPEPAKKPPFVMPQTVDLKALVALLPLERREQRTILEMIIRAYEKHGLQYVSRNIRYANRNAKKSYRPYLIKALHEDYGLAMQEDEEAQRKETAQKVQKVNEEEAKRAADNRRHQLEQEAHERAKTYIAGLNEEQRKELERQAIGSLVPDMQRLVLEKRMGWRIMYSLAMEKTATRWIDEAKDKEPIKPSAAEIPE